MKIRNLSSPSYITVWMLLSCLLTSLSTSAQTFESGEKAVPLIELYTSQGCSSCPPADRWLSTLGQSEHLWSTFVPLAFHVDYWDYIGWKDPFARHEFSQRQRRYAKENNEATVYTPGVRKSGEEWRHWYLSAAPKQVNDIDVGKLRIDVDGSGRFDAEFSSTAPNTQLNVALLGIGLRTKVTRGENRGKTLNQDFVVLAISRYATDDPGVWQGQLPSAVIDTDLTEPELTTSKAAKYAVAAWVTQGTSLKPIQATGGLLSSL